MPSATTFLLAALGVYAFTFLIVRMALSSKQFKEQPVEDQERARKQFRWALLLLPFALAGTFLLVKAPPEILRFLPLVLYLLLWGMVFWLLWRSYNLGIKRDVRFVKAMNGKPMRNAEALTRQFATANLLLALAVAATLVAVPLLGIQLKVWAPLLTIIFSCYTLFSSHYERKNAA